MPTFYGLDLHPVTFIILLCECMLFYSYTRFYVSRPTEDQKCWQLIFLIVLFTITAKQIFLQILNKNVLISSTFQFFLGRGFGYVLASYFPVYLSNMLKFESLKWHGRYGALCILVPVAIVFSIIYPIRQNLMEVRIFMFVIPISYFLILLYDSLRSIISYYQQNKDKHKLKEQLLIVMNVTPWIIVPPISIFLNASIQVCDLIINAPFLVSNWIFDGWIDRFYLEKEITRKRLKTIGFQKEVEGIGTLPIDDNIKNYFVNLMQKINLTHYEYKNDAFDRACQQLNFTPVQRLIMWQMTLGNMKDKEIAKILGRSHRTIEKQVEHMRNKSNVHSRAELLKNFNLILK